MRSLIDVAAFQSKLAVACRKSFTDLLTRHPHEQIYGFAIYTVDDLAGINPSASAESGFEQRKTKFLGDTEHLKWLREKQIDLNSSLLGDHRWSIYEWEHECHLVEAFDAPSKVLQQATERSRNSKNPDALGKLGATVLATMVRALKQLESEHFFDSARQRHPVTLFCSKPSSYDTHWFERESARRLNAPSLFETFSNERIRWITSDRDIEDKTQLRQFNAVLNASGLFGSPSVWSRLWNWRSNQ